MNNVLRINHFTLYFYLVLEDANEKEYIFSNETSNYVNSLNLLNSEKYREQLNYAIQKASFYEDFSSWFVIKSQNAPPLLLTPEYLEYLVSGFHGLINVLIQNKPHLFKALSYPGGDIKYSPEIEKNLLTIKYENYWNEHKGSSLLKEYNENLRYKNLSIQIPLDTFIIEVYTQVKWLFSFSYQLKLLKSRSVSGLDFDTIKTDYENFYLPKLIATENKMKSSGFWDPIIATQPDWYTNITANTND